MSTRQRRKTPSRPLKTAVVGLGAGRHHARVLKLIRQTRLVALVDPNEDRLRKVGAELAVKRLYTGLDQLLDDGAADAVVIAVPNDLHAPLTLQALRAGLHVMVEKPMAMNAREAWRMTAEARKRGLKLMIHFNQRFDVHSQQCRRIVERGDIGAPCYARTGWRRAFGIPGGWFSRKERSGGGPLIDLGVHMLDVTRFIMGNPAATAVSAHICSVLGRELCRLQGRHFDVEDFATAMIRFENGVAMDLEVSWAMNTADPESRWIEVYGTEGSVVFRTGFQYETPYLAVVRTRNGKMKQVNRLPAAPDAKWPHIHFARAILEDKPLPVTPEEGAEIMEILDAVYRSAELGREVRVSRRASSGRKRR